jgi:hypothetical protein
MKAPKRKSGAKKNATPDKFSIYLKLRHGSSDLADISNVLSMKPAYHKAGERTSVWRAVLAEGSTAAAFSKALKTVFILLTRHRVFFQNFISSGGTIDITLNYYADVDAITGFLGSDEPRTGLTLFELTLYPEFTQIIAEMGITLELCVLAA